MKPWSSRLAPLLAALLLSLPSGAAPPLAREAVTLVPPETNLIARLDVGGMQGSPLAQRLRADYRRELGIADTLMSLVLGFVPDDVAHIWLFASEPDRGVLLLEGEFSSQRIASRLARLDGLKTLEIDGIPHVGRLTPARDGRVAMTLVLSDRLLALGDEQAIMRLLAAWRSDIQPLPRGAPALARVAQSNGHLAATLRDPAAWPAWDPGAADLIEDAFIQGRLTDDLDLQLRIAAVDAEAAEALENLVRGWLLIERRNARDEEHPLLHNALAALELTRRARVVNLSLLLPGEQIVRQLGTPAPAGPRRKGGSTTPIAP